ncbi:unnamed protein product [Penicillium pancosmium]
MSRQVDKLTPPSKIWKKKVIVASASRSGTLGLYGAMKILGYRPYHLYECVCIHGATHIKIFKQAVIAQFNWLSGVRRLKKFDCEKWLADYDKADESKCIIEITSYLGMDVIEAYAEDPEVKFILTERDPRKWARSFNNTSAKVVALASSFPFNVLKYFQGDLYHFMDMNVLVNQALASGTKPGDPENEDILCEYYSSYIKNVKSTIPADRLCLIQLEDGIDWDTICPFLGVPVPKEDYPDQNQPERFEYLLNEFLQPKVRTAMLRCGAVAVAAFGIIGWAAITRGPSILPRFMGISPP